MYTFAVKKMILQKRHPWANTLWTFLTPSCVSFFRLSSFSTNLSFSMCKKLCTRTMVFVLRRAYLYTPHTKSISIMQVRHTTYFPAPYRCTTMHIYTYPAHPEWVCAANETPPVSPGLLKNYTIRFFNWNPPGVWYGVLGMEFILRRSPASPAISHVVAGAAHRRRT